MGSGGRTSSSNSSSSGEEDGDADWMAAINSVAAAAATTLNGPTSNGGDLVSTRDDQLDNNNNKPQPLKHYQIKVQKLLDGIMEKNIEIVRDPILVPADNSVKNEGGIRLFKTSPAGILFDHVDELQGPTKRPRIVPGQEIDEKSKKFRRQIQSVAITGMDIIAAAQDAGKKSLAKLEAKDAAAKAAAKREDERVAELKRIKGERWLPSIARERQHHGLMG